MSNSSIVQFSADQIAKLKRCADELPGQALAAIQRGVNRASQLVVAGIQEKRLTGQGPFPVSEGRLGVRTNRLRSSLRATAAQTQDGEVTATIGTNVVYAAIHEYGGVIERTVKPGSVRLRTDKKGNLLTRGNLAIFAKRSHKLAKEVSYAGGKQYRIVMPARHWFSKGIADNQQIFATEITSEINTLIQE